MSLNFLHNPPKNLFFTGKGGVGKEREMGIDDEAIQAAIETGHMVEKGAMSAMRKFSAAVLEPSPTGGCGCSTNDNSTPKACCG